MSIKKWLSENTMSLSGKRVAVTGSTGGLGKELCLVLASLGAQMVLLNRSKTRTDEQIEELKAEYPDLKATYIPLDLSNFQSVKSATEELKKIDRKSVV